MKTIDFSYFIERYNAGEMDEAELTWFTKELEGNRKLREETELRKKTDKVLQDIDLISLRMKLSDIERTRAAAVHAKSPGKLLWKFAAAVACLVILGSAVLLMNRKISNEEIISKYYKPYESVSASRSQSSVVNPDYAKAVEYYNVRDFRNAELYFGKVLESDPKYIESTMYYGVSKYEESKYPEAVQKFRTVVNDGKNLFIEDAQWYLALCYIQTQNNVMAVNQLNLVRKSESIYSRQAGKILRKIK